MPVYSKINFQSFPIHYVIFTLREHFTILAILIWYFVCKLIPFTLVVTFITFVFICTPLSVLLLLPHALSHLLIVVRALWPSKATRGRHLSNVRTRAQGVLPCPSAVPRIPHTSHSSVDCCCCWIFLSFLDPEADEDKVAVFSRPLPPRNQTLDTGIRDHFHDPLKVLFRYFSGFPLPQRGGGSLRPPGAVASPKNL